MFPSLKVPDDYKKLSDTFNVSQETFNYKPERQPGPFSALWNYEEEKGRMEESYARREAMNQKVARGNAIVDGVRMLIQGFGGAAGATIPKEAPNQSIIKSYDDYRNMDSEQRDRLERFRMLELNNMGRDIQYQHGLEAEQRGREFAGEQAGLNREFQAGEAEIGREFTAGEKEADRTGRSKLQKETIQGQKELEQFRVDSGHYSYQDRSYGGKGRYNLKGVTITPDIETKAIRALQMMYEGQTQKPRVLNDIDRNNNVQEESIRDLILQHWDDLTPLIPELSGAQSRENIVATPQANNQQIDTAAYEKSIAETLQRTDMNYRKKFKFIRDAAMEAFGLSKDDAERYAKELLGPK